MNKFLIAFAAVLAVCSSVNAGYGLGYGSNIGGYQLQQQPAVTVTLVPQYAPSYGGSYGQQSYGSGGYAPISIPVPSYGGSYGSLVGSYGSGVDAQAVNLAYQALNAPSAGLPLIADPVITPNLVSTYGPAYTSLPSYSSPAVVPGYGGSADAATAASAAAASSNVANSKLVGPSKSY